MNAINANNTMRCLPHILFLQQKAENEYYNVDSKRKIAHNSIFFSHGRRIYCITRTTLFETT